MRRTYLPLRGTLAKNQHSRERATPAAIKSEISREIFRLPGELRMTVLRNSASVFPQPVKSVPFPTAVSTAFFRACSANQVFAGQPAQCSSTVKDSRQPIGVFAFAVEGEADCSEGLGQRKDVAGNK